MTPIYKKVCNHKWLKGNNMRTCKLCGRCEAPLQISIKIDGASTGCSIA